MDKQSQAPRGACRFGCVQPEAYCLMLYRDTAGNEEWIWNSRDAVTPFGVTSRQGLEARHVEWHRDRFAPFHEPKLGDRIFANMTMETARARAAKMVAAWWDHPETPMRERYESRSEAIESIAKGNYESFGAGITPTLIEVTEEVLNVVHSHRPPRTLPEWQTRKFA